MNKLLLLCVMVIFAGSLSAQVNINEDSEVADIIQRHIQTNKSRQVMDGWRIQIVSTSDRTKVESVKEEFMMNFSEFSVDWIHVKPNYKLRAGAFVSKLEALEALNRIKRVFPSAYIAKVRDMNPREIIGW